MAVRITLDVAQMERLQQAMQSFGVGAGQTVDEVLHNQGGKRINDEIMRLLPSSNRKWRGKVKAASKTQPFTQENGSMSVTIRTKYNYHYLYFPDDGSNTKRHQGNQQFMYSGAENAMSDIIDACTIELLKRWESD